MRKKFGKLKILMICFLSSLLIWILIAAFSIYQNQRNNKKVSSITQLSTKPPVDRLNRTYFAITKSNNWTESNDMNLFSYEAILANTTDKDLKDWCIKLKVPDETSVENTWDCTAYIDDNYLYIKADELVNEKLCSKSETHFGILLISENDLTFRSAIITGRLCKKLSSNTLFIFCCIMAVISLIAAIYGIVIQGIIKNQATLTKQRQEHDNQIIEQTMKTFSNFIDNKDTYTQGHSTRVAAYAREMAKRMGLDQQAQLTIYYAGLMHDIGKLTIADDVLNKTSRLSTEEWSLIQQHTTNGAMLLKNFTILPEINDAVLYHHERFDGTGYMNRMSGKDIPLVARIVGIADAYDAMNTNRCYRLKFSEERIISELDRCRGKQFDPDIVPYLISMIKDGTVYRL
ncbi:MAG: HD domain-containing protein [Treponema sp.]|uniref:HD-GYP domain-containing protein n=1 Tax=Treponema sp. TaxID=166 RepID=UPI00298E7CFC|nr:HD domain-containing phosphohydrolase [Treponema sp.]MBR5933521.1 HD domain-containing protein [Treponema sp.]